MKALKIIAVISLSLLTSCASRTQIKMPDENGKLRTVCEVQQSSVGNVSYDPKTGQVNVNTMSQSFWQKNIIPILSNTIDKASRTVRTGVD